MFNFMSIVLVNNKDNNDSDKNYVNHDENIMMILIMIMKIVNLIIITMMMRMKTVMMITITMK